MNDELKDAVIDAAEDIVEDAAKKIVGDIFEIVSEKVIEEAPHITRLAAEEIAENVENLLDKAAETTKPPS